MELLGNGSRASHMTSFRGYIPTFKPSCTSIYSTRRFRREPQRSKQPVNVPCTRLQTPRAVSPSSMTGAASVGPLGASSNEDLLKARVAVMSIPACPYCKRAKEALTVKGITYVDVNVDSDPSLRQLVRDITGKRTVPQIFVAGRSVGGCDDLLAQLADGTFTQLLAEAEAASLTAVPSNLLSEIQGSQKRSEAEAKAPSSTLETSAQRLEGLKARLELPEALSGIARSERIIESRIFRVFTVGQLLDWLSAAGEADPRTTAAQLLQANAVTPATVDKAVTDRVVAAMTAAASSSSSTGAAGSYLPGVQGTEELLLALPTEQTLRTLPGEALNMQFCWQGPARPASEVSTTLRQLILELYDKHLSPDGRSVSYGAIRSDPQFAVFVAATAELQKVDLSPLSREGLMSFAINLYNALIIHALVALNLTRMSTTQRATFFSRTAKYNIGGVDYSADDLENGVLRGNRAGASNVFNLLGMHNFAGGHWRREDPRLGKVVQPVDPRIHFALVCGAKSCPPIKLYTPSNLEEGLAAAAEAFCADEVVVNRSQREVHLSKIFKWYAIDFGPDKYARLSLIATFLSESAKDELLEMVRQARSGGGDVRLVYKEYDWSLNGTD